MRIEHATSRVAGRTVAIKPLHHCLINRPAVIVKFMLQWARHFVKLRLFPWTSVWLLLLVLIATQIIVNVRDLGSCQNDDLKVFPWSSTCNKLIKYRYQRTVKNSHNGLADSRIGQIPISLLTYIHESRYRREFIHVVWCQRQCQTTVSNQYGYMALWSSTGLCVYGQTIVTTRPGTGDPKPQSPLPVHYTILRLQYYYILVYTILLHSAWASGRPS